MGSDDHIQCRQMRAKKCTDIYLVKQDTCNKKR